MRRAIRVSTIAAGIEFTAERERVLHGIAETNDDLEERLSMLAVTLFYDPDDDFFALRLGEPREAWTESFRNRIFVRYDPATLKIVGIEIPDLRARIYDDAIASHLWLTARSLLGPAGMLSDSRREFASRLHELIQN